MTVDEADPEFDEKHFLENLFGGRQLLTSPSTQHLDLAQQAALQGSPHQYQTPVKALTVWLVDNYSYTQVNSTSLKRSSPPANVPIFGSGPSRLGTQAACAGRSPDRWLTFHRLERV
jgi:hypothetical protein